MGQHGWIGTGIRAFVRKGLDVFGQDGTRSNVIKQVEEVLRSRMVSQCPGTGRKMIG